MKYPYVLIVVGFVFFALAYVAPAMVGANSTGSEEDEQAMRQASAEVHGHGAPGEAAPNPEAAQASLAAAQALLAERQAAFDAAQSRGWWARVLLIVIGVICAGAGVTTHYMNEEN